MTDEELFDALDGLYAYDQGATDSGIHDERLRQRVSEYLDGLETRSLNETLRRYLLTMYLSDEAFDQGYGVEDVRNVLDWLYDEVLDAR